MSEIPGGSTPSTPAGWYPTGDGQERWWDGNAWSDHHVRPVQQQTWQQPGAGQPTYAQQPYAQQPYSQQPYAGAVPPGGTQPYYVAQPAQQGSSTARTVLIVIGVLMVLLVGGCVAVVATVGVAVDSAVEQVEEEVASEDAAPGGVDNPLTVSVGQTFDIATMSYGPGWSLGPDALDLLIVEGLTVTNTDDVADVALVEVTLLDGAVPVAETTCSSGLLDPGEGETLTCFSSDTAPAEGTWDTVTVSDPY